MRKFESADSTNSEELVLGLPELSIPHLELDAGNGVEQRVQSLPRIPFRPSLFYCGPTGLPLTIRCLLFPIRDPCCFVEWRGPDLFSPYTCSEDVFTFLNFLFPGEPVGWLNTRLSITSRLSGEIVVDLPFTILPSDIYTESLRCFQLLVNGVLMRLISCWCQDTCFNQFMLHLAIWPWQNRPQEGYAFEHREEGRSDKSLLEPEAFVQNIVGNF